MNESENSFSPRVIQLNHFIIVRKKGKFIVDNKNLSTKIFALRQSEYFNQEIEREHGHKSQNQNLYKGIFLVSYYQMAAVAASTSTAATAVLMHRLPTTKSTHFSALPYLPPRFSAPAFSTSFKHSSGSVNFCLVYISHPCLFLILIF